MKAKLIIIFITLPLLFSCDWDTTETRTIPHFDWDIQGTWTTNDPGSVYN